MLTVCPPFSPIMAPSTFCTAVSRPAAHKTNRHSHIDDVNRLVVVEAMHRLLGLLRLLGSAEVVVERQKHALSGAFFRYIHALS